MDRSGSVEDMVSGIWRLGASGMGRTDSEAAFQEFLKKIPSSSNLAAQAAAAQGGSLDAAQQLQLQQQALLQQQAQAQAYQDVANAQAGGIPRVPSLDLLRQQLQHLQSLQQLSMHNPNGDRAATNPIASQALRGSAGLMTSVLDPSQMHAAGMSFPMATSLPQLSMPIAPVASLPAILASLPGGAPSALQGPNAAALLQMGHLQGQRHQGSMSAQPMTPASASAAQPASLSAPPAGMGGSSGAGSGQDPMDNESMEKAELRRKRRMLSNRESARRSRKRKQEHLSQLETEKQTLAQMKEEKDNIIQGHLDEIEVLRERAEKAEAEAASLKAELEALKGESDKKLKPKLERPPSLPRIASAEAMRLKGSPACSPGSANKADMPARNNSIAAT